MVFISRRMVFASSVGRMPFGLFFEPLGRPLFPDPALVGRDPSVGLGAAFWGIPSTGIRYLFSAHEKAPTRYGLVLDKSLEVHHGFEP